MVINLYSLLNEKQFDIKIFNICMEYLKPLLIKQQSSNSNEINNIIDIIKILGELISSEKFSHDNEVKLMDAVAQLFFKNNNEIQ